MKRDLSQKLDWRKSVMDLPEGELIRKINQMDREDIIDWLAWNDRNGVYRDRDSMLEFGNILEKEQAGEIMYRQIMREREDWDGFMGDKWIGE